LQAAKIMRRFFYEAPAEIMRNYTTVGYFGTLPDIFRQKKLPQSHMYVDIEQYL